MEVRIAHESDLPQIYAVGTDAFGEIAHSYITIRQLFCLHSSTFLIAREEDILGYVIAAVDDSATIGHMVPLAVAKRARKNGIGTLLTQKAMASLIKRQVREIHLVVSPDNSTAINLYSRLGFGERGIVSDYYGPGQDRLVMVYAA